jgi:hypothetical protein
MKNTYLGKLAVAILVTFILGLAAAAQPSKGALTEAVVKQVISDNFTLLYKEYPDVKVEFGPIRMAAPKKKFGVINKNQETTVTPVKVVVTIKVTRSDGTSFDVLRGDKPDQVFLFYQNEFDEWSFRIGSSAN